MSEEDENLIRKVNERGVDETHDEDDSYAFDLGENLDNDTVEIESADTTTADHQLDVIHSFMFNL